jgi:hypothetical protein
MDFMKSALKLFAGTIMVLATIAAGISFSSFIDHKGREAAAIEKEAKTNPYEIVGTQITTSFEFRQAEADEVAARAAADHDIVVMGLAVICLLLASGIWLLADISNNLPAFVRKSGAVPDSSEHGFQPATTSANTN